MGAYSPGENNLTSSYFDKENSFAVWQFFFRCTAYCPPTPKNGGLDPDLSQEKAKYTPQIQTFTLLITGIKHPISGVWGQKNGEFM